MRKRSVTPLLTLSVFFLFSCAGAGLQPSSYPLEQLQKSADARQAMSGAIKITNTQGGKSVTAPGVLLVEWPDKLRLEVQDPVGSILLLLVVQGDRFWLYQQDRKENLTGPLARLPMDVSLPFRSQDLVRVFLGRPYYERFRGARLSGNGAELLTKEGKERLRWNENRYVPEEWMKELPGRPAVFAEYEDFASRSGALYPTKLRLRSGAGDKDSRSVLVAWGEWEASVPAEKKLFQIPQQSSFGRPTKALP